MHRSVPLLLAVALMAAPASAQQANLEPGARVRVGVNTPVPREYIGTFDSVADSALLLRTENAEIALPLASVTRIERSLGRKANIATGAIGFVVGGAAGGALGCLWNQDDYGVYCGGQDDTKVIVSAAIGAAAGATVGALLFKRERWVDVDRTRLSPR